MIKVLREIDKNGKYVSRDGILYSIRFVKNDETLKSYEEENTLEIEDLDSYNKIFDIWNIRPITKEEEMLEIYKSNPLYSSEYEYYDKDGNLIFYSSVPKDCSSRYRNNTYIKSGDIRCEVIRGVSMFYDCKELLEININDSPLLSTSSNMFRNCLKLKKITISKTESLSDASNMFNGCSSLTEVSLGDLSSLSNGSSMFYGCSSLSQISLGNLSLLSNGDSMFRACSSLSQISLGDLSSLSNGFGMFAGCLKIIDIILNNLNNLENGQSMFEGCENLIDLTITNLDSLTNGQYMFYNCKNLSLESCQMIANLLPDRSGDTSGTEYPLGVQHVANWNDELTQFCTNKGWTVYE